KLQWTDHVPAFKTEQKRSAQLCLFQFEDGFNFDGYACRKLHHSKCGPRMTASVAEDIHQALRKAVYYLGRIRISVYTIHQSQHFDNALYLAQITDESLNRAKHVDRDLPGDILSLFSCHVPAHFSLRGDFSFAIEGAMT